jgi:hypothetical protein
LPRFSIGMGDRFAKEGVAQLRAVQKALAQGVLVAPVWNKSWREHSIIGTNPSDVRAEADAAARDAGWEGEYFVDADHINLGNVDGKPPVGSFIGPCDFFTLDVADAIGKEPCREDLESFVTRHKNLPAIEIKGKRYDVSEGSLAGMGRTYLSAIMQAAEIYRFIEKRKGAGTFVTEVSMDETKTPQTPVELLFILRELALLGVPLQTIAPKFTGEFHKGVDYVGDAEAFAREFEYYLAVIEYAVRESGLPGNLKLSIHSGSDKFSLYGCIHDELERTGAGVHLKTAGTTWLEEVTGLAEAGGEGLAIAKEVYRQARTRMEEFKAPYLAVISIDDSELPVPDEVDGWTSEQFVRALRHEQGDRLFNPSLRQLVHIGYKAAAEMGGRYLEALAASRGSVERNVTENLYERHIKPLLIGRG